MVRWRRTLGVILVAVPAMVWAQTPLGSEFQVNTYTTNYQYDSALCHDGAGNFVVVWESQGQDGDNDGVFGQRYGSAGNPLGTEFQVNTYTTDLQADPAICCAGGGSFVVVWNSNGQDGDDDGVFAQRYDSGGQPVGTEFQVNTETDDCQEEADVCCSSDGSFVVTWESEGGQDGDDEGIFGQRFDSAGLAVGSEFQVNSYTTSFQSDPSLCCDAGGNFVVSWESDGQDGDDYGIFGQRYVSNGSTQGTEFQVNTFTSGSQNNPDVCCGEAGSFVVVWTSSDHDGSDNGVFGQRYSSSGAAQGIEFQVNTYTTGYQDDAEVCCDSATNFVVVWESAFQDGDYSAVIGRRFSNAGVPQSGEFQVNTYTTSGQNDPDVTCTDNGNFVVVWSSYAQDGSAGAVFGQRFSPLEALQTPALSWPALVLAALALVGGGAVRLRWRR